MAVWNPMRARRFVTDLLSSSGVRTDSRMAWALSRQGSVLGPRVRSLLTVDTVSQCSMVYPYVYKSQPGHRRPLRSTLTDTPVKQS